MATKKINILSIGGITGSGKDYLVTQLLIKSDLFHRTKQTTTRPKRNEKDCNYDFLTKEEFDYVDSRGHYIARTDIGENKYGTHIDKLDCEKINLVIVNTMGLESLNKLNKQQFNVIHLGVFVDKETAVSGIPEEEVERLSRSFEEESKVYELCNYIVHREQINDEVCLDSIIETLINKFNTESDSQGTDCEL